jgi:hypothetical protein
MTSSMVSMLRLVFRQGQQMLLNVDELDCNPVCESQKLPGNLAMWTAVLDWGCMQHVQQHSSFEYAWLMLRSSWRGIHRSSWCFSTLQRQQVDSPLGSSTSLISRPSLNEAALEIEKNHEAIFKLLRVEGVSVGTAPSLTAAASLQAVWEATQEHGARALVAAADAREEEVADAIRTQHKLLLPVLCRTPRRLHEPALLLLPLLLLLDNHFLFHVVLGRVRENEVLEKRPKMSHAKPIYAPEIPTKGNFVGVFPGNNLMTS